MRRDGVSVDERRPGRLERTAAHRHHADAANCKRLMAFAASFDITLNVDADEQYLKNLWGVQ
jgi:hypothetical protein